MSAQIIIQEYDPRWPDQFECLRSKVADVLNDIEPRIEHVGSTAVPGLAAKPIIDVDVFLVSNDDLPAAITGLAALGYEHRGDLGVSGRQAFRAPAGNLPHQLYVFLPSSGEGGRHILFREFLRCHPEHARAYEALKRNLAQKFGTDH